MQRILVDDEFDCIFSDEESSIQSVVNNMDKDRDYHPEDKQLYA